MRVLYATDIHGAKADLESLLELTTADVYLVAGDLIYSAFYTLKSLFAFFELQEEVRGLRDRGGRKEMFLKDFAADLYDHTPDELLKSRLAEFLRLSAVADRHVRAKYRGIENILKLKTRAAVYVIPGNYDVDLRRTALVDRNLHLRAIDLDGCRIAGYGSANVRTPGIPDHLVVPYRERREGSEIRSEPAEFFRQVRPHIMLVHNPPFGFNDRLRGVGNVGSAAVRKAAEEIEETRVVLSGHVHEDWGVHEYEGRIFVNPSNFGEVVDANGYLEGGTFFEFEMRESRFEHGLLRKIEHSRVCDLVEYRWKGEKLAAEVIDLHRVNALSHRKPSAEPSAHAKLDPHIPEITRFNKIRFYFRRFETGEAEERVEDLRKVVDKLASDGYHVAFDIVGSVNFGMSDVASDLDVVAYSFVRKPVIQRLVSEAFEEAVGDKYKLELTDVIDLNEVQESILHDECSCDETQRYVFYRAIGRPVNLRMLRQLDDLLELNPEYRHEVEERVREYIHVLQATSSQTLSIRKYESRLLALGTHVAPHIEKKIKEYLQLEVPAA